MTDAEDFRAQQIRIERYRALQREVTDPLAACLLREIVWELEATLRERQPEAAPRPDAPRHAA